MTCHALHGVLVPNQLLLQRPVCVFCLDEHLANLQHINAIIASCRACKSTRGHKQGK